MNLQEYLNLVIIQHRHKPKFMAVLCGLLNLAVDSQNFLQEVKNSFDVDSAVSVQLDQVGLWVGISRRLHLPLTGIYFEWNTEGVGWLQGYWKGRFDPDTGMVLLPDDEYRILIKAKIAANQWDGTIPGAYKVWSTIFPDSYIVIEDHQDMSMAIGIAGLPLTPVFEQLLIQGYIPLKPAGVRVSFYAVTPDNDRLFAWNAQSDALGGWNEASWPNLLIPS